MMLWVMDRPRPVPLARPLIIGQHHGLVECESEPGKTDFIIFLPLEENQ